MATFGALGLYLEAGHGKPPRAIDGDEACYTAKVSLAGQAGAAELRRLLWVALRAPGGWAPIGLFLFFPF
jgi:hypothetical protein